MPPDQARHEDAAAAFEVLRTYLEARATFSPRDLDVIRAALLHKHLDAGEFFQRAGDVTRHAAFVASGLAHDTALDALPLRADARVLAGFLQAGRSLTHELAAGRDVYLVPSAGRVMVNGMQVDEGDGVAVTNEMKIEFTALRDTQLVVVELA